MTRFRFSVWMILPVTVLCSFPGVSSFADETDDALKSLRSVSHRAAGNQAAQDAYQVLIKQDRSVLPDILNAFDGANPLAENYLRSAFEVIWTTGQGELPLEQLEAYLGDLRNNQKARTMVFEYLSKRDPDGMNAKLKQMLDDPAAGIRFLAVQKLLEEAQQYAENNQTEQAVATYRRALQSASVASQVKTIEEALAKEGVKIDLPKHFGLLTDWKIIGPFDNTGMKSFDVVYPPEKELDFSATYDGKEGKVSWQTIGYSEKVDEEDIVGTVDIAKSHGKHKGAVMYMYTEYVSPAAQEVFVRMATSNAWKLWVNDELIFEREEYHRGMRWDQYRVPVSLKQGTNRILLKILQNEQTESWAQDYSVQFRITDQSGKALLPAEAYDPSH